MTGERHTVEGWRGRAFEDFEVGDVYLHPLGHTVTATENAWFTHLTLNTNPIHFDAHYAAQTEFGRPLVNSCLTLALVTGMSVSDVSQRAVANLGWETVRLPAPLFEGDTLYAESVVLGTRPSASRPEAGIVRIRSVGYTQEGKVVIEFERIILVYRQDHAPERPRPSR